MTPKQLRKKHGLPDPDTIPSIIKCMVCASTGHVTNSDRAILERSDQKFYPDYIGFNEYGWFVETVPADACKHLDICGFSPAYIKLITTIHAAGFCTVCFDADGDEIDGFELFEW